MYEINLPEQVYKQATRAAAAHHLSVEDFIIEAVQLYVQDDLESHDHIFTPQVLAELGAAAAESLSGKTYSGKRVDDYLAETKAAWQAKNPG